MLTYICITDHFQNIAILDVPFQNRLLSTIENKIIISGSRGGGAEAPP